MNRKFSLEQLSIQEPCPANYAAMRGDGASRRFCDHCRKHVHDLSLMTLSDAERLICESAGGGVCVRMTRDIAGQVVTLDYQPAPPASRWWQWRPVTMAVALAGAVCTFFFSTWTIGKPPPPPIMGSIAAPVPMGLVKVGEAVMGDIAPTSQPSTQPSTQPAIMGKIRLPTTDACRTD